MPPPRKVTPTARMSWPNTWPRSSVSTLPMYAARPPKLARPHTVLAAEPPLISTAVPSAAYSSAARSISTSVIDPFTSPCSTRKASVDDAITSTRALPMPVTSKRAGSRPFMIAGMIAGRIDGVISGTGRHATAGTLSPCLTRPRSPTSIRSIRSGCPRSPGPPATTSGSLRRCRTRASSARSRSSSTSSTKPLGWCSTPPN